MPSWTEKPHVIPTINVNLRSCDPCCEDREDAVGPYRIHVAHCPGSPVLIPLSLAPFRSVTFEVRMGECRCTGGGHPPDGHWANCRARPIRVACSISGKTWEESEPCDEETFTYDADGRARDAYPEERAVCRERWALVKALVTGDGANGRWKPEGPMGWAVWDKPGDLFSQRDAVYAALADMARDEDLHEENRRALFAACPAIFPKSGVSPRPREDRPSARNLSAYVEYLIEQVGVL